MSSVPRKKNGFFMTKKGNERKKKALQAMSDAKKRRIQEELPTSSKTNVCEGIRIVNIKELGKNLRCRECSQLLDLSKVHKERMIGSLISIRCDHCKIVTEVNMAHITNNKVSEVNSGLVLGTLSEIYIIM